MSGQNRVPSPRLGWGFFELLPFIPSVMTLLRILSRATSAITFAALVSCGTGVSLEEGRRDEARSLQINPTVVRPMKLNYSDSGTNAASMTGAVLGGAVGAMAASSMADSANAGKRDELEHYIQSTVGEAGRPLREAMAKSLQRKKVATVNRPGSRSRLTLEYKQLGLMPLQTFSKEMQIVMEVEVILTGSDGKVIWRTSYGSYPHNDQLPVRTMDQYRANPQLFGKDLEATCSWVTDILADYLRWEMGEE